MSGPRPPGADTGSSSLCIQYTLYGIGDRNNAKVNDLKIVLHAKGLTQTGKKAALIQRIIDNRALWEGGGASTSPPATTGTTETTETAPHRSNIILVEGGQTANNSAPPTEATPEDQNKGSAEIR